MTTNDLDDLFRLRLAVARHGEADGARWWNTNGVLGPRGRVVYGRGFPRTAAFAAARVAFAAARARCAAVFSAPWAVTLWALPPEVEEAFEDRWEQRLDDPAVWTSTFEAVEGGTGGDLLGLLVGLGLLDEAQATSASALNTAPRAVSVELPGPRPLDGGTLRLLAGAFACGRPSSLVVPFCRLDA